MRRTKKGEEKKPAQNICFDLFFKGVCSAQKEGRRCEYSHDTAELVKYGKLQTEKYNNAPGIFEDCPVTIFDPGIVNSFVYSIGSHALDNNRKPKLLQTGHLSQNFNLCESSRIILDTGATAGNYVTRKLLTRAGWDMRKQQKVNHHVRLGDGETAMQCQYSIQLDLTLKDSEGVPNLFGGLNFFIIESDKDEVIIGIDSLLGPLFDFLIDALKNARQIRQKWQAGQLSHSDLFIIDKYVEGYWNPETNDILIPFLTPYTISPEEEETPLPVPLSVTTII
jgi:hypothetical protein